MRQEKGYASVPFKFLFDLLPTVRAELGPRGKLDIAFRTFWLGLQIITTAHTKIGMDVDHLGTFWADTGPNHLVTAFVAESAVFGGMGQAFRTLDRGDRFMFEILLF